MAKIIARREVCEGNEVRFMRGGSCETGVTGVVGGRMALKRPRLTLKGGQGESVELNLK